jgi:hypothetical protein
VGKSFTLPPKRSILRIDFIIQEIFAAEVISMCNCRVCELTSLYPEQVDRVIDKVFEYMMEDKNA